MSRSTTHELQPKTDHDGLSRRLAVLACKGAIRETLQVALKEDFDQDPERVTERTSYRLWSGINRASQDRMWGLLAEQVDVDLARIDDIATDACAGGAGTLELGQVTKIPDYQQRTAIHGQPGGYMLERSDHDLAAGVLYEAGGNIYALGQGIGQRDSKGERLIAHIREHFPDFEPRRILEMGCSAGGQSTDYPGAFPDAEIHAIDLSPGMLRYAHARAELLGTKIHFHQQDAGATTFPDAHFDLIISHNLFHEVAGEHMPAILRECYRLLAPGGACIHQDVPIQKGRFDDFQQFLSEWQTSNNDEPFWMDFANADLRTMLVDAGFDDAAVGAEYLKAIDGPIPWYVVTAQR
ncbi:MAG: class I SAM-dependent methyltransferase [Woeseiaceae bacterium]